MARCVCVGGVYCNALVTGLVCELIVCHFVKLPLRLVAPPDACQQSHSLEDSSQSRWWLLPVQPESVLESHCLLHHVNHQSYDLVLGNIINQDDYSVTYLF